MKKWMPLMILVLFSLKAFGQDSITASPKLLFNGYIKDLESIRFNGKFKDSYFGNIVQNRLNFKYTSFNNIIAVAEIRNRLIWAGEVNRIPNFESLLRNGNEYFNLQTVWKIDKNLIFHTNIERLNINYKIDRLNVKIGRQRVNWGLTSNWNPNDIYNANNFLDFDYEERPGIDGVNIEYALSNTTGIEMAYANAGGSNSQTVALKYSLNKFNYDIQFIGGSFKNRLTAGLGWAGYIQDTGFKGEIQYFSPLNETRGQINMALEGDYMFKNGWYLSAGFLYYNLGLSNPVMNSDQINLNLSPGNLMPTKWNFMLSVAKEISPLLSVNYSSIYSPGINMLIFYPSLQYSLITNLDVNFVYQSLFVQINTNFKAIDHQAFIRLKFNF